MNLTKAAAIVAIMVTVAAGGDLCFILYQDKVEDKFEKQASRCALCTVSGQAAAINWNYVQSHIKMLNAQGKNKEAAKFAEEHANQKPVDVDLPCSDCDLPGPDYNTPGSITAVGMIASAVLFAAARRKPARWRSS
jgi:hypothetical protein